MDKYFKSETGIVKRSEIQLSSYNPRTISEEGKKELKRSIKRYGVVGGIVVNRATGNTIVGGHQKVKILDEIYGFPAKDYELKVEFVDLDEKTEKQLNIILNNPNVGGDWDYDRLRELMPDIDYKEVGLTAEDLNLIGVDYLLQTQQELDISNALDEIVAPERAVKQAEKEAKQMSNEEKITHNKEVKAKVREQAEEKAQNLDAYVTLSFDTFKAKASFMKRFGFDERDKFIKGELFSDMIERVE